MSSYPIFFAVANAKLSGGTPPAEVTGSGFGICFLWYLYSIFRVFQINPIIPVQEDEEDM
jgi:hypothetical protein